MNYKTIQSENIYHGRVFSVRRDEIELPNGSAAHRDIIDHGGAVTILPLDSEGQIWFVRQYRHAAGVEILELPAGMLEEGEPPEMCARREIREEVGLAAGHLQKIGEFYLAPGYSTEYMYVYLATNLFPSPLPGDDDEFLSVESIPIAQVFEMAKTGSFRDAKTLAALLLVQPFLDASDE